MEPFARTNRTLSICPPDGKEICAMIRPDPVRGISGYGASVHEPLRNLADNLLKFGVWIEVTDSGHPWRDIESEPPTAGRRKDEYGNLLFVGTRKTCTVSFQDSGGVRHAVEVGAETLYETAVLALKAFREHDCAPAGVLGFELALQAPLAVQGTG